MEICRERDDDPAHAMRGNDDAREEGEVVEGEDDDANEEWSPIREPFRFPASQPPAAERFAAPAEEDGAASSDMDTDDDGSPTFTSAAVPLAAVPFAASEEVPLLAGAPGVVQSRGEGLESHAGGPSLKRKRLPELGGNAIVQVTYQGLTRESKNVLQQALQNWSAWNWRTHASGSESFQASLESGTEVYSPGFNIEPTSDGSAISAWIDKPAPKKSRIEEAQDNATVNYKTNEEDVPLYDRACISPLTFEDSRDRCDGYASIEPEEPSRCFNCGSYCHTLMNCRRPHVSPAIKKARDTHFQKRRSLPRSRTVSRYYQSSPGGKFDDLKAGILSSDARKGLGIGEWDPPPWLHRMRELGYPPGYLDDEEISSGMEIFGEDTGADPGRQVDEVDTVLVKAARKIVTVKRTVEYPGINAPIPEKADKTLWESVPVTHLHKSSRNPVQLDDQVSKRVDTVLGADSVIPSSPSPSRMTNVNGVGSRDGTTVRGASTGQWDSHTEIALDGMSYLPGDSNPYAQGTLFPSAKDNAGHPADPGRNWFPRRASGFGPPGFGPPGFGPPGVDGSDFVNGRFGGWGGHHSPSRSSGLSSLRGILGSPSESVSSPPRIFSRQNFYHTQAHGSISPAVQFAKQASNESWAKAQAALNTLNPTGLSGAATSVPLDVSVGAGSPRRRGHR